MPDSQLRLFWHAYLKDPKVGTAIVYTRNLFYHDMQRRFFLRQIDINDPTQDLTKDLDFGGVVPKPCYPKSRHYVAAGDADCVLNLTRFLEHERIKTQAFAEYERSRWKSVDEATNYIWLGNKRNFPKVAETLEAWGSNFHIEEKSIFDCSGPARKEYADDPKRAYGIVTRAYDEELHANTTIICGSKGGFFEGIGKFLINEDMVAQLKKRLRRSERTALPPFEALLGVDLDECGGVSGPMDVHLVDARPLRDTNRCRGDQRLTEAEKEHLCVILFNLEEKSAVKEFKENLRKHGVYSWCCENIPPGSDWPEELRNRFGRARVVLALGGKLGLGKTERMELGYVLALREMGRPVEIVPVILADVPPKESPFENMLGSTHMFDLRSTGGNCDILVRKLKDSLEDYYKIQPQGLRDDSSPTSVRKKS